MDYILRKAKSSDAIRIEELFAQMLKAIYHTDDVEGYETGYLDKFFLDKEDWICVAEYEKDVVAFLSIEVYRNADYIYLDDLSVAEGYRNQGIGTKLIHAAEKYAEEIGISKIVLHVDKTNKDAYRFYWRLGYSENANEGSRIRMKKSVTIDMNENTISRLCIQCFSEAPRSIERCAVGQGNYVFIVECSEAKYVVRCSSECGAYENTAYWLERLASINIPVPKIIAKGKFGGFEYLVLSYFEGKDIGLVYAQLSDNEKKEIAREIVRIQNQVAELRIENIDPQWSWRSSIDDTLERARERIAQNGYFDVKKVDRLYKVSKELDGYFSSIEPTPYLDDISTKNLLIHHGRISGIVDIDWIGIGDKLTYVAMTNMALLNMECDTDYVKYILDEMQLDDLQKRAFLFYTLMYCVDFMGERGMQFMDKFVEVNAQIVDRFNRLYDTLWDQWKKA